MKIFMNYNQLISQLGIHRAHTLQKVTAEVMPMWKCKRAHRNTKSPIYEGRNICAGGEKGRVS